MTRAELFRARQEAISLARAALKTWCKTLPLPVSDATRRAAYQALREAQAREDQACAAYKVACDLEDQTEAP